MLEEEYQGAHHKAFSFRRSSIDVNWAKAPPIQRVDRYAQVDAKRLPAALRQEVLVHLFAVEYAVFLEYVRLAFCNA